MEFNDKAVLIEPFAVGLNEAPAVFDKVREERTGGFVTIAVRLGSSVSVAEAAEETGLPLGAGRVDRDVGRHGQCSEPLRPA